MKQRRADFNHFNHIKSGQLRKTSEAGINAKLLAYESVNHAHTHKYNKNPPFRHLLFLHSLSIRSLSTINPLDRVCINDYV